MTMKGGRLELQLPDRSIILQPGTGKDVGKHPGCFRQQQGRSGGNRQCHRGCARNGLSLEFACRQVCHDQSVSWQGGGA
jgi:hypothetical protein